MNDSGRLRRNGFDFADFLSFDLGDFLAYSSRIFQISGTFFVVKTVLRS